MPRARTTCRRRKAVSEMTTKNQTDLPDESNRSWISPKSTTRLPAAAILDTWSGNDWSNGVQIDRMADLECLYVETQNSIYEITIICGRTGEIFVRGGKFFPEKTVAHLAGATFGGSFMKMRGIYVGFRMELLHAGLTIITTPVRTIGLVAP